MRLHCGGHAQCTRPCNARGAVAQCAQAGACDVPRGPINLVLKHLYHARGSDGRDYEVHVYVEPAHQDNAWIERIAKVCLADGGELRVLSHHHYEVVATGVRLATGATDAV